MQLFLQAYGQKETELLIHGIHIRFRFINMGYKQLSFILRYEKKKKKHTFLHLEV